MLEAKKQHHPITCQVSAMLNVRILSKTIGENQQPQDLARKQNQT